LLATLSCPGALFRSEHGLVTPEMADEMAQIAREQFAVVDVPAAGHHPMLDQPLALVTGLRTLFTFWPAPR
jgi:pimeloyl-ACP methyl ester carboxylesterase